MVLSNVIFPPLNYASYIQALLPQYEELISREASVKCPATYAAKASLTCTRTVHGTGHQWQVGARVHLHCKPDLCQVDSVRTLDWTRGRIINTGRSAQSCHNFYLTTNRNLTKKKSNQIKFRSMNKWEISYVRSKRKSTQFLLSNENVCVCVLCVSPSNTRFSLFHIFIT